MKMMRDENKGFSIIELLVALAIGAILVAGIGSIMIVSSKSFASTSGEAGMQSAAQIVMDHIQDVAIDANQKVGYSYTTADVPTAADWTETVKDSDIAASYDDITYKKLSVYNYDTNDTERCRLYEITWKHDKTDDEKSEIWYKDFYLDEHLNPTPTPEPEEKLADNVVRFSCDLTDIPTKRILFVELDFKKGTKEYHAANNISLRNKVALSVNTVSMDASVSVNTLDLNAEPGMDLPLTVKNVKTTGNASNKINFELKDDSGKTAAGTEIIDKKTLHVDPSEQAPKIKVWATAADTGDSYEFYVWINRVLWTNDIPGGKGIDTTEGIVVTGSEDVGANVTNIYSVTLNSNPGASVDRTVPARVSAKITAVNPAKYTNSVSLNTSGSTAWQLIIDPSVPKDTTITMRFTALHSLSDPVKGGGMSVRNKSYPDGLSGGAEKGIYKEKTVKVKKGIASGGNDFFRGMIADVPFKDLINDPDAPADFFDGTGSRWLLWRPYRTRFAVADGHNAGYDGAWSGPKYTDEVTKLASVDDYTTWHKISGGYNANFHGEEFNCLSPNYDTEIQFFIAKCGTSQGDKNITAITGVATSTIFGFRSAISFSDGTKKGNEIYLGTQYLLDDTEPTWFNAPYAKVWQLDPCFANLANVQNAGFNMKMKMSRSLGSDGEQICSMGPNPSDGGDSERFGSTDIKMSRQIHFPDKLWTNTVKNKVTDGNDPYYIWPGFDFTEKNHGYGDEGKQLDFDRLDAAMKFYVKKGNISVNGIEAFVPWPKHDKGGVEYPSHEKFYGKNLSTWTESYQNVGNHEIKNANNQTHTYKCSMCFKDETYWLKLRGVAIYKYNSSTERWDFVEKDVFAGNLVSGLSDSKKDVFLPGPKDEEFYTGFKSIQNSANTDPVLATDMTIYFANDAANPISNYKIAYYRKDSKYYVNIYWLKQEDKGVYKKFYYDETAKEWKQDGNIFNANINFTVTYNPYYKVDYSFYVPTRTDKIDWYEKFNDAPNYYQHASGMTIYKFDESKISIYTNNPWSNPKFLYKKSGNQPFMRIEIDGVYVEYYYNSGVWNYSGNGNV